VTKPRRDLSPFRSIPRGSGLAERRDPETRERRVAGALFFATCCSVFLVYWLRWRGGGILEAWSALLFTATLMSILLGHEMGHYAAGRLHGIRLALPWFLPAPFLVGTFGAIIRWSDVPRTRSGLLEMAAAGPLAGLGVVLVVLLSWMALGPSVPVTDADVALAQPLLWWIVAGVVRGAPPPAISPEDPLGFAAWIGGLVTAMNLLPVGQLDGGHILYALSPRWARIIGWAVTVALLGAGFWWAGWAAWAAIVHLLGAGPATTRDRAALDRRSKWIAAACCFALILCLCPIPIH
jgi:membrane-associated protease RseP (regulator of RpoE activity)